MQAIFGQLFYRSKLAIIILSLLTWGALISLVPGHAYSITDQTIINLTNKERTVVGLPTLAWNSALTNSAILKAQDMCSKSYWAHTAPDGTTGWTFMNQSHYPYITAGENLAKGYSDDASLVAGWMASPTHRANILNSNFIDIGVGSATCNFEGLQTTFVVAHYGATKPAPKLVETPNKPQAAAPEAAKKIATEPQPTKAPATAPQQSASESQQITHKNFLDIPVTFIGLVNKVARS